MSGKTNRKHGRTKNSQAQKRYVAEKRSEKNKARHIAKTEQFRKWCAKVRAKATERVRDVGRQIRKLKRGIK